MSTTIAAPASLAELIRRDYYFWTGVQEVRVSKAVFKTLNVPGFYTPVQSPGGTLTFVGVHLFGSVHTVRLVVLPDAHPDYVELV